MASFSLLTGVTLTLLIGISSVAFSTAQRVFLSSNNPTPCYNNTVDLICYYPDVMERANGQPRYTDTTASWKVNGELIFPIKSLINQTFINQTASRLRVRIDPAHFTGDPVSFTCYLPLTSGGEDSASTVVDPQDTAAPPTFTDTVVIGTGVTVSWDHTDKGPCFNHLTFSYNVTWYPVVGGVPQRREGQSGVTGPGVTEYIITNLMKDTNYRAELVGFTSSDPIVRSEVATVDFRTKASVFTDDNSGGGGDTVATLDIVMGLVFAIINISSIALIFLAVCVFIRRRGYCQSIKMPRASRGETAKQMYSSNKAADAVVPADSGDAAMPLTSNSEEATSIVGHQEQHSTEYPSDQWQETPVEAVVKVAQHISFMDDAHKESSNPAVVATAETIENNEEECMKVEDSELAIGSVKMSQPPDSAPQEEHTKPLEEHATPLEEHTTPLEEDTTPLEEDNAPLEEDNAPLEEDNAPLEEDNALLQEHTQQEEHATPQEEHAIPPEEHTTPLEVHATPLEEDATPLEVHSTPLEEHSTPLEEHTTPLEQHSTPLEEGATPLEEHTTPLEGCSTLLEVHATPLEEDTTPVEEDATQQEPGPSCDEEHDKLEAA